LLTNDSHFAALIDVGLVDEAALVKLKGLHHAPLGIVTEDLEGAGLAAARDVVGAAIPAQRNARGDQCYTFDGLNRRGVFNLIADTTSRAHALMGTGRFATPDVNQLAAIA